MAEKPISTLEGSDLKTVKKFRELFNFINYQKLDKDHQNAYEEAVSVAKKLINTKTKSSWDSHLFEINVTNKFPGLSRDFISALKCCIENYNPPVNLPDEPLW